MTKLFAVLLACALTLSLVACGKKDAEPTPSESPLPSPPAQEAPQEEVKEDKSNLDPFEIEAVTLAECLVKSIDDIEGKTNKVEFDYEDFMLLLALVEDEDFTYYSYAPRLSDGSMEIIPARCEIIAYQIFGKEIPAKELVDDDFYNKEKDSYIIPDGIGFSVEYMAENLEYTPSDDQTSCVVTFDLLKETAENGDPVFKEIGKGNIRFVLSSEKGGAYWTYNGFTLV